MKTASLAIATSMALAMAPGTQPAGMPHVGGLPPWPDYIAFNAHPEGVAVDKAGHVFVSVDRADDHDQIWRFATPDHPEVLVDLGSPGYACGLAVDPAGNVYMARPMVPGRGVYRVDANTGEAALLPGTDQIVSADALAFGKDGTLYVTELFSLDPATEAFAAGGIWRLPRRGAADLWLRHDLLTGLAPLLFPFPVGANGIAFRHGALYVANSDKALIVRIPVLPDGSPGEPEVWSQVAEVEGAFEAYRAFPLMLDGLALDVHGNAYVAVPSRSAIVRINAADRSQETIAAYPDVPLDTPLSLAFGTGKGEQGCLFVTNGGMTGLFLPGVWPGTGLVRIDVGVPGMPLP